MTCHRPRPPWLATPRVVRQTGGTIDYCVVNDLASLVWVANLADIELHTSLALGRDYACPTAVVFDLDPGPPAGLVECARIALRLRDLFAVLDIEAYAKTSGGKGMQVYLPVNRSVRYDETKAFARRIAQILERKFPGEVVSAMKKSLRPGKVLIDWSQNTEHKTTVVAYSMRATDPPCVSTPLAWEEVAAIVDRQNVPRACFGPNDVLARVAQHGDRGPHVITGLAGVARLNAPLRAYLSGHNKRPEPNSVRRMCWFRRSKRPTCLRSTGRARRRGARLDRATADRRS